MACAHEISATFAVPLYALERQINPGYSTNTTFERSGITFQLEKTTPSSASGAQSCRPSAAPGEGEAVHRETVEINLKDKTPCGVPQDSLVSLAGSKSFFFLYTMKYNVSVSQGPGHGNWGCARCQLHSSS